MNFDEMLEMAVAELIEDQKIWNKVMEAGVRYFRDR